MDADLDTVPGKLQCYSSTNAARGAGDQGMFLMEWQSNLLTEEKIIRLAAARIPLQFRRWRQLPGAGFCR